MNGKITDLGFLRTFTGGQKEKLEKYINMFLTNAPAQFSNAELYLKEQNWSLLKTAVHSLKPQLGYMGAKQAEDLAKTIELNASTQTNLENIPAQLDNLKNMMDRIVTELKDELTRI